MSQEVQTSIPFAPADSVVVCRRLPEFVIDKPEMILRAFQNTTSMEFRQAWREQPEDGFAPATVRVGWRDDTVLVFAEMIDADIFSDATGPNQETWRLGDTFEMFFRPLRQRSYLEFHVTPNNHQLQLRFANKGGPTRDVWEDAVVRQPLFRSRTWVWPEADRWFVFAGIPAASICEHGSKLSGCRWRFSFGRYDYRRNATEPVLSSTSPHAEPDFHRQHEWGTLTFEL